MSMAAADETAPVQERDDRAHALMQSALALVPSGRWCDAAAALEDAAGLHALAHRTYDEARCLQLAATLRRSAGQTGLSRALTQRAAALAPTSQPLKVSIFAEQAETAQADGRLDDAVAAWTAALDTGRRTGLKAEGINAMLRRRAAAHLALGQVNRAASDFDEAAQAIAAVDPELPLWVRLEQADLLRESGRAHESEQVLRPIEAACRDKVPSAWLRAELCVQQARLARTRGQLDATLDLARKARATALDAVAPLTYFAASAELAETLRLQNDLPGAYGTLATAWATLGDLLGEETARSWVEPCLLAYQLSWGESAFQQARAAYESQRRVALSQTEQK
jgi:tetratricopeptide (TPR) repeat protein